MNLYSYNYMLKMSHSNNIWFILLMFAGFCGIIYSIWLYLRNRNQIKYRDIATILALILATFFLMQSEKLSQVKATNTAYAQMADFMKRVAKNENVPTKDLWVNQTHVTSGMIFKINDKYYRIDIDSNQISYSLVEVNLLNADNVTYNR
ncbi:MAG: DUF3290 domain-containing protein [Lactobacillus sp.]|nr:DUF3290 domain-containing protein [Lactobacillus sp.]